MGKPLAPDGARNREGGRGTHRWLGKRRRAQSNGYVSDKPITTAFVEATLAEGALRLKCYC